MEQNIFKSTEKNLMLSGDAVVNALLFSGHVFIANTSSQYMCSFLPKLSGTYVLKSIVMAKGKDIKKGSDKTAAAKTPKEKKADKAAKKNEKLSSSKLGS